MKVIVFPGNKESIGLIEALPSFAWNID